MTGRANRRRGHDAERAVAAYLREQGWPDACTSRSVLGHDGTRQPGDVVGVPGWVISVKDVAASSWPSWCRQAEAETTWDCSAWVVVRRLRGSPDVGSWPCQWGPNIGEPLRCTFAEWVDVVRDYERWKTRAAASRLESRSPTATEG